VVFLSYDEPNADQNYNQLLTFIPWAERVHGVKGSDAAHKACANLATTDRVVIVDGDNYMVRGGFLDQTVEILDNTIDLDNSVISWPSINTINDLVYGNGGIKCWARNTLLNMRTHESADPNNSRAQIDFCWDINYIPLDCAYTKIHNNSTPFQAWRAGFREGVKMSLDQGTKIENLSDLPKGNLKRLLVWTMVGADVEFGHWAMLGARQGCYMTQFTDWNYVSVRDFDYLEKFWNENVAGFTPSEVYNECIRTGNVIKTQISIGEPLSPDQSKFFKMFDSNTKRQSELIIINEN
jgi:hypothetical protein